MALEDYRSDMETCCRCSLCKFVPQEKINDAAHANVCPSIARYGFHAYSGGGRLAIGTALLDKRIEYSDKLLEVVYNCQLCGACDISCKYALDMEVLEPLYEIRASCVEAGRTLPILDKMIQGLRERGSLMPEPNSKPGEWFDGLKVKELTHPDVEVIFFAGCRTFYDPQMWNVARTTVRVLQQAGVEVGIAGKEDLCCGGLACELGYKADFLKQAQQNLSALNKTKAKVLVTSCAECYHAFNVLYPRFCLKAEFEVLHATEYCDQLLQTGRLKPEKSVDMRVTYHDPCHLGRLGEPYIPWNGKQIPGHMRLYDPPKEFRRGTKGIYQPPRNVLNSIPGLTLVEMDRIKEYAWCCGAGGGVREVNPEFARWTVEERIAEAESTGADAVVSACPGCERQFTEAVTSSGKSFRVFDVIELLDAAL